MENRTLRFKAWNINKKKMSSVFDPQKGIPMLGKTIWIQSTGMFDVKDMECFEGDIIFNIDTKEHGFVTYDEDGFWVTFPEREKSVNKFRLSICLNNLYEVRGNIYQNSPLTPTPDEKR